MFFPVIGRAFGSKLDGVWIVVLLKNGGKCGENISFPSDGIEIKKDDERYLKAFSGVIDNCDIQRGQWGLIRLHSAEFSH